MPGMNLAGRVVMVFLGLTLVRAGTAGGEEARRDGGYEGESGFVAVSVTVAGGRIAGIRMIRHGGGGEKYAEMVRPLLERMVEAQSVEVDTVTGATVSSNYLKEAVAAALRKAAAPR